MFYPYRINNQHTDVTEADIKGMFEPHGKVDLVNLPKDRTTQKPRGFAFVDMASPAELEAAIAGVDGTTLDSREIRVMKSVAKGDVAQKKKERPDNFAGGPPNGTKKIYMGNIPFTVTKDEIKEFYTNYGEVLEVYIPPNPETGTGRGFAFVTMKEEDAAAAIEGTNGADFGGRTLVVNEPLPPGKKAPSRTSNRTKLYVGNLSFYTVVETLQDIFGEFGEIIDCYLPEDTSTGGSRGFGFVTMAREDALRAVKEIDGCEVDGRVIRVNEAQPKGGSSGGRGGGGNNRSSDETGGISSSWDDMNDQ
jgi:RNA recognition motif-containing protein